MCSSFVLNVKETWANSANKFFDSLASKKPIFINHGGWMKDLINFHQCGYCSHRKNLKIVARELHKLMNNKKWIKENGKNA